MQYSLFFFFQSSDTLRYLHSFPTRRSSDLYSIGPATPPSEGGDKKLQSPLSNRGTRWDASSDQLAGFDCRDMGKALFASAWGARSEEHTSELQSRSDLVCRLLLEKKKKKKH